MNCQVNEYYIQDYRDNVYPSSVKLFKYLKSFAYKQLICSIQDMFMYSLE